MWRPCLLCFATKTLGSACVFAGSYKGNMLQLTVSQRAEKHHFHSLEWSKKDLGVKQSSLTWKIFDKTQIAASSSSHDKKHELKRVADTLFVATRNGNQIAFVTDPSEAKCFQRGLLDLSRSWMDFDTKPGSWGCERISVRSFFFFWEVGDD